MQLKDMEPVVKKFYTGLEDGIYWARQCPECGAVEFPPHLACNACGYHKTDWVQVSGHGHLIDFTLPGPQNDKPYLKEYGKYAYGAVDIDEFSVHLRHLRHYQEEGPRDSRQAHGGRDRWRPCKVIDRPGYKELTFELDD